MATILVVDDDRKLLKMIRRILTYEGYQVVTARDGRDETTDTRSNPNIDRGST